MILKPFIGMVTMEKEWKKIKKDLIGQGKSEEDDIFYPTLVTILKKKLGVK